MNVSESPGTLRRLCLEYCAMKVHTFCHMPKNSGLYVLKNGVQLPSNICEAIINHCREAGVLEEAILHAFADQNKTRIKKLNVSNCNINDMVLRWFLPHKMTELNISNCGRLSNTSLAWLNKHGETLVSLCVGSAWTIFIDAAEVLRHGPDNAVYPGRRILHCPNLKVFSLHGLFDLTIAARDLLACILQPMTQLTYLDLSNCRVLIEHMPYLEQMVYLTTLILHGVPIRDLAAAVKILRKIRNLKALDLSQGKEGPVIMKEPEKQMRELVSGLPYLKWLDIAGTNLAGFLPPGTGSHAEKGSSDDLDEKNIMWAIPGLEGRQFEFLGLMDCPHDACERDNIPAKQITGSANEEQVYLAIKMYIDKSALLCRAMNHLFGMFRFTNIVQYDKALRSVLLAMEKYPHNCQLQTLGCTCLMFILKKGERPNELNWKTRRQIIIVLLNAMEHHKSVLTVVKRACLPLSYFELPDELMFSYDRVIPLLLWFVEHYEDEQLNQICLYILKYLSSQVDIVHKELAGHFGAIQVMAICVVRILQSPVTCEHIMLRAWSILWSLTDVTPVNCEIFLNSGGIQLFLDCYYMYPDDDSIIRKMVGMMCNVAEVPYLRIKLMANERYLSVLVDCLNKELKISNSAGGVLAHLLSEPSHYWKNHPKRSTVQELLRAAITEWDVECRRNVRYRSFGPTLLLFEAFDTPESQHWAVWEVCNMVKKDRERYTKMFRDEGGVPRTEKLLADSRPYPEIKELAVELLSMCNANLST